MEILRLVSLEPASDDGLGNWREKIFVEATKHVLLVTVIVVFVIEWDNDYSLVVVPVLDVVGFLVVARDALVKRPRVLVDLSGGLGRFFCVVVPFARANESVDEQAIDADADDEQNSDDDDVKDVALLILLRRGPGDARGRRRWTRLWCWHKREGAVTTIAAETLGPAAAAEVVWNHAAVRLKALLVTRHANAAVRFKAVRDLARRRDGAARRLERPVGS